MESTRDQTSSGVVPPYVASMVHVTSYDEITEILRSRDFVQGSHEESMEFVGGSVLVLDGEEHRQRRRMLSPLFSKGALLSYERDTLVPVIDRIMADLKEKRDPDGFVRADVVPLVRTMLLQISAMVAGVDDVDTSERTKRFEQLVDRLGEAVTVEWSTRDHEEMIREGIEIRQQLIDEYMKPSLDRRRELVRRFHAGEVCRQDLPTDLLTFLALHWDDTWDKNRVWRETGNFLVAAIQTTTHTTPHVIVHVDEWLKEHTEDAEKVHDPEFLRLATAEALRMHQPAPTLLRTAIRDTTLSSGRIIRNRERVALFFSPANRQTDVFGTDANTFNPYREVASNRQRWGLTFGAGVHQCIGRPLVTGMSRRNGDEAVTEGTIVKMLRALYSAGVALDPERPARRQTSTMHDTYESLPVLLTRL